jgi:hypothetical protein
MAMRTASRDPVPLASIRLLFQLWREQPSSDRVWSETNDWDQKVRARVRWLEALQIGSMMVWSIVSWILVLGSAAGAFTNDHRARADRRVCTWQRGRW